MLGMTNNLKILKLQIGDSTSAKATIHGSQFTNSLPYACLPNLLFVIECGCYEMCRDSKR